MHRNLFLLLVFSAFMPRICRAQPKATFPAIFESAFVKGHQWKQDSVSVSFYPVDMGMIHIESGKIIACDPIVMDAARPFTQSFPVGLFPVQLSIARFRGDERVAFSRIDFSDKPAVRWEFALDSGKKQIPLAGDSLYGYSVDAGIGMFIDSAANRAFNARRKTDMNLWDSVFINPRNVHAHSSWQYNLYTFQDHNLACFSTGLGDGSYGVYVGYDSKGKICRLLTDFGLVRW
jgi:Protein of unknown function (DUF4241)